VILLIPGTYNLEQTIDINAPQAKVFAAARNLPSWHLVGMMGMMQSVKKMPGSTWVNDEKCSQRVQDR
jgi:hypothetical protein